MKTYTGTIGKRAGNAFEVTFGAGNRGRLAKTEANISLRTGMKIPVVVLSATVQEGMPLAELSYNQAIEVLSEAAKTFSVGSTVQGAIKEVTKFGVFIEIDAESGLQALVYAEHIIGGSNALKDLVVGEEMRGVIIRKRSDGGRPYIDLSQTKILELEMASVEEGQIIQACITKITAFGAYARWQGLSGLLHKSQVEGGLGTLQIGSNTPVVVLRKWHDEAGRLKIDFGNKRSQLSEAIESAPLKVGDCKKAVVRDSARDGWPLLLEGLPAFLPRSELGKTASDSIKKGGKLKVIVLRIDKTAGHVVVTRNLAPMDS